ncbi:MAG: hypothetical protein AB1861_11960 [Cyanobacteriota bacterium]
MNDKILSFILDFFTGSFKSKGRIARCFPGIGGICICCSNSLQEPSKVRSLFYFHRAIARISLSFRKNL